MKKPGAVPPATRPRRKSSRSEDGLSPCRSDSVLAQPFSSIHELTGALTQGAASPPHLSKGLSSQGLLTLSISAHWPSAIGSLWFVILQTCRPPFNSTRPCASAFGNANR